MKEWQSGRVSAGACASHRPHGTWLATVDIAHASTLSPLAYAQLTRPVHAFLYPKTRVTPAQHNYAFQLMYQPPSGEHHNYLDVALRLQPRTTTQLQGNESRPRVIHYADDTVLLFPQLPFLLYLLLYDALSHHVYVFLFVSVNPETKMVSHDKTATQDQPVG